MLCLILNSRSHNELFFIRNGVTCAFLVWVHLMQKADETGQTESIL